MLRGMAALRTLWRALVSIYEETLTLVGANLAWVALNVPVVLVLAAIGLPILGSGEEGGQWLLAVIAWLLLLLPTPASIGLGGLAQVAAGPDVPRLRLFWATLRGQWRLGLKCMVLSVGVAAALLGNVYFYAVVSTGWLRFAAVLWLYGALFWLAMHVYLVPLLVHISEPRLIDLYRRAALIALGHPLYTLLMLVAVLIVGLVCIVFLPAYLLVGGSYVAMVQAHAFREIRRRHGDLVLETETDDEGAKL
jgi:uncharacterized membrane protein YesL